MALAGEVVVVTQGGKVDEGAGGTHGRGSEAVKGQNGAWISPAPQSAPRALLLRCGEADDGPAACGHACTRAPARARTRRWSIDTRSCRPQRLRPAPVGAPAGAKRAVGRSDARRNLRRRVRACRRSYMNRRGSGREVVSGRRCAVMHAPAAGSGGAERMLAGAGGRHGCGARRRSAPGRGRRGGSRAGGR